MLEFVSHTKSPQPPGAFVTDKSGVRWRRRKSPVSRCITRNFASRCRPVAFVRRKAPAYGSGRRLPRTQTMAAPSLLLFSCAARTRPGFERSEPL